MLQLMVLLAYIMCTAATLIGTPTLTPSPTVMIGGVNLAAAVAIPVVLIILLLVICVVVGGVCYYLCCHKHARFVIDLAKI